MLIKATELGLDLPASLSSRLNDKSPAPQKATPSNTPIEQAGRLSAVFAGTILTTPEGPRPVEVITPGTLILTKGNGFVPLFAIGKISLSSKETARHPELKPVSVPAGAFSNDQALCVSHATCFALHSERSKILFGESYVLVNGKSSEGYHGISQANTATAQESYVLVFWDQEVFNANGAWVTSEAILTEGKRKNPAISWTVLPKEKHQRPATSEKPRLRLSRYETRLLFGRKAPARRREFQRAA